LVLLPISEVGVGGGGPPAVTVDTADPGLVTIPALSPGEGAMPTTAQVLFAEGAGDESAPMAADTLASPTIGALETVPGEIVELACGVVPITEAGGAVVATGLDWIGITVGGTRIGD
jgi:hypothetical protein